MIVVPAVGMYDLNHNTIAEKQAQTIEVDPDLVIEKPPFLSNVDRFKYKKVPKSTLLASFPS